MSDALPSPTRAETERVSPDELMRALDAAQAQIDDLGRQLENAGRLALLGTLAATVAHEFNNLLTPSIGYAQLALKTLDDPEPDLKLIRKALTRAHDGGEKAGRIGDAILKLARGAGAETAAADCDVAEAVEQAVLALGREPAKDGIALRLNIPAGLRAAVEAVQLEHVLLNLLLNARGAMLSPGGRRGTLGVAAAVDPGDGAWLTIAISDTGCGIALDRLPRLFDPFYTGSSAGNGLGLNLCRRIVERHDGRIAVRSEAGQGSTFTLRLPLAAHPRA